MTDLAPDISDHEAGPRDPQGHPRCTACGFIYPCPDVRRALPDQPPESRAILELVDVGWGVWKAQPRGSDAPAVGGLVVGWQDIEAEGVRRRLFTVLDFPHGRARFFYLDDLEIDVQMCSAPKAHVIRDSAKRLALEVAQIKGVVDVTAIEQSEAIVTLLRSVI